MTEEQEIKLRGEIERGSKAQSIFNDSFVQEALQAVENGILEAWKKSPLRDVEGQTNLRLLYKVLTDFKGYFVEAMTTGKMASVSLEHERSIKERAKEAMRAFAR